METNFYWHQAPPCPCCKRPFDPLHIGKSSAGWNFTLQVYPKSDINTLSDWQEMFKKKGSFIKDEYDREIPVTEMLKNITERQPCEGINKHSKGWFNDNDAEVRNGLMSYKVDGEFCVGHGSGTFDYVAREFS